MRLCNGSTKFVLTVIAVSLCTIALPRIEMPEVMAASGRQGELAKEMTEAELPSPVGSPPERPAGSYSWPFPGPPSSSGSAALQLRWRVRHAVLYYIENNVNCLPIVSVRNIGPSSTEVTVDWSDHNSTSAHSSTFSVAGGATGNWGLKRLGITNYSEPFVIQHWGSISSNFRGSVHVQSDDPRISVAAFLRCDTAPADRLPASVNSLPADPVGATLEYFLAGMPAEWRPPVEGP